MSKLTSEEFKICFDQYFDAIRNYLYYRSGNAEGSTDIAQEVFMKLWEKQIQFDPQRTKGLLYKMASDMFISQLRKDKVASTYTSAIELKLEQQDPLATLQYKELKDRYEKALVSLPEKQRTVFLMNRIEELTYKEISERLDLSIKAVEKRMTQALSELRKNLLTHE